MTNAEIDASAAGQKFIGQLAKTDKADYDLGGALRGDEEQIIDEGQDLGAHLAQTFLKARSMVSRINSRTWQSPARRISAN